MISIAQAGHAFDGRRWIYRHLSSTIARGEVFAILGPNGRGKTTLMRCIVGLLQPTEGRIVNRGPIGFVPQSFANAFPYSVLDIVLMGRARHVPWLRTPSAADTEVAVRALAALQLEGFAARSFDELSGGERQLVLIARALASESPILVLDEPASALDLKNQDRVLGFMRRLASVHGLTIVFTTHQPNHALAIADRALLMVGPVTHLVGDLETVLTEDNLAALYGVALRAVRIQEGNAELKAVVPVFQSQIGRQ